MQRHVDMNIALIYGVIGKANTIYMVNKFIGKLAVNGRSTGNYIGVQHFLGKHMGSATSQ
jgi:hypothetical protein